MPSSSEIASGGRRTFDHPVETYAPRNDGVLEKRAYDVVIVVDDGEGVPRLRSDDIDDGETQSLPYPLHDSRELFILWRPCDVGLPGVPANDVGRARETAERDLPAGALIDRRKPVPR
jgi:hypothetical protein